ncbi:hypothetical protein HN51_024902 [Arachis hypogaea]
MPEVVTLTVRRGMPKAGLLHRERIDERMKALPELVSSINKTNRNIYSHSDGAQTLMFYDVSQDEPQVKGRLPNCIAKYLEERCYKELRSEHIKFVNIVAEAFNKLISHCKVQIHVETLKDYAVPKILEISDV